jgi:hypothetical protein
MMSGKAELSVKRRKDPENKGFSDTASRKECPERRAVSGLSVPKKHSQKTNDLIGSTPKPDRITEGQRGWNLEPSKSIFPSRLGRSNRDEEKLKPPPKAD